MVLRSICFFFFARAFSCPLSLIKSNRLISTALASIHACTEILKTKHHDKRGSSLCPSFATPLFHPPPYLLEYSYFSFCGCACASPSLSLKKGNHPPPFGLDFSSPVVFTPRVCLFSPLLPCVCFFLLAVFFFFFFSAVYYALSGKKKSDRSRKQRMQKR